MWICHWKLHNLLLLLLLRVIRTAPAISFIIRGGSSNIVPAWRIASTTTATLCHGRLLRPHQNNQIHRSFARLLNRNFCYTLVTKPSMPRTRTMTRKSRPKTTTHCVDDDDHHHNERTTKRRRSSRLRQTPSLNKVTSQTDTPTEEGSDANTPTTLLTLTKHTPRRIAAQDPPPLPLPCASAVVPVNAPHSDRETSQLLLYDWIHHSDVSFHDFTPLQVQQIQVKLLQWYSMHRRRLPWRGDSPPWNGSTAAAAAANFSTTTTNTNSAPSTTTTTNKTRTPKTTPRTGSTSSSSSSSTTTSNDDSYMNRTYPITPYGIWVSEIMLQQTRVEAVIVKWCQFMSAFPNVTALAEANLDDLNAIWAGLGYYRRLKLLHTAAQIVVTKYDGIIPTTIPELLTLPGIGRYTAHAVASIAHDQNVPVVDGNVCRVLSRLRGIAQTIKTPKFKDQYGWGLAQQLVAHVDSNTRDRIVPTAASTTTTNTSTAAGDINQALMELGATYCAPSGSGIHPDDPLKEFYWSTQLGLALAEAMQSDGDNDTATSIDSMLAHAATSSTHHCQLCATSGVSDIVTQFRNQWTTPPASLPNLDGYDRDRAQQLGHRLFPLPPPKVHKKEELIVILAISRFRKDPKDESDTTKEWLLMKRPDEGGLLSGQWEFPSISVWQSEDEHESKKKKGGQQRVDTSDCIPILSISQRRTHIHAFLKRLGGDQVRGCTLQTITNEPIHHIFSHIRHTIYIEHTHVDSDWTFCCDGVTKYQSLPKQWMSQTDMQQVGITSGVKKVWQAIEKSSTQI